jgi:hypothetical protein
MQLGPIRQAPASSITRAICFSRAAPSALSSLKPADRIINALVFLTLASSSTETRQCLAAIAMIGKINIRQVIYTGKRFDSLHLLLFWIYDVEGPLITMIDKIFQYLSPRFTDIV